MPIDPNSETSDIGMMYRQYLQSKGMPLTQGNLQSVIAQSQREPGMIAGLGVQQADTPSPMSAPPPPNIAGASAGSSGGAMPIPPTPPTGIPVSAPLPHAPFPASASDPASAPVTLNSVSPAAQQAQSAPANAAPPTPPPGQPPQSNSIENTLEGLGAGGGVLYALKRLLSGGDYGRPGSAPQNMVAQGTPGAVAPTREGLPGHLPQPVVNSGKSPLDAIGPKPDNTRIKITPEPMADPNLATAPIGNILYDKPVGPEPAVNKPSFAEGAQPTPWKGEGATVNPAEAAAARAKMNYPGRTRGARVRVP